MSLDHVVILALFVIQAVLLWIVWKLLGTISQLQAALREEMVR